MEVLWLSEGRNRNPPPTPTLGSGRLADLGIVCVHLQRYQSSVEECKYISRESVAGRHELAAMLDPLNVGQNPPRLPISGISDAHIADLLVSKVKKPAVIYA